MTYRAWNTKTVDRAALKELTAAIAQQNTEELEMNAMDDEPWSEQKYAATLAAQQKEVGLLAGILAARGITVPSALYAPSFESAEAVDETGTKKKTYTKDEHYEEVQGRTRAFLTRIYEALKAAIKKFFGWLNDWQHRQRTNAARLPQAIELRLELADLGLITRVYALR